MHCGNAHFPELAQIIWTLLVWTFALKACSGSVGD